MQSQKKVLIVLEMNEVSGRRQLSGILRFLGSSGRWNIRLLQRVSDLTPEAIRDIANDHFDGLLTGINAGDSDKSIQKVLSSCSIPAVFMDAENCHSLMHNKARHISIRIDNAGIGRTAAQHLMSLGRFRSFGFVPEKSNPDWSKARERAFCGMVRRSGGQCSIFSCHADEEKEYHRELAEWVQSLPKPAAVFCAWDTCAIPVMTVCHERHVSIPEQMALLSVDDDEFLCNLVSPALSSIRPDFEGEGFLAAKTLDMMIQCTGLVQVNPKPCKVEGITERGSTKPISPSGFLVQRALEYISKNAIRGIGVSDVAAHLGVSRSLLDLRFRQMQKRSVLHTIRQQQLEEVKRLLDATNYPIARIASMCGFKSENHPKNLFREAFEMSMFEYRHRARHRKR